MTTPSATQYPQMNQPILGIPKENREGETRVAMTPDSLKKIVKKGFRIRMERGAGITAGYPDADFAFDGVELVDAVTALGAEVVIKINRPTVEELAKMKKGSLLICMLEPFAQDGFIEKLAQAGINAMGMELIPRTSRAQSMDVLSSQANIAGYRAVLEAATRYPRFFPMMMTSAGSAKPARVVVLGAGVAGLQAIGTARRLGCQVEAYDVRAEVKEQILSLGAKFIELDVGEEGTGAGGYAKELSEAAKLRQQQALTERLKKADVIITTANIPGRKAPILVTEEAVKGMRAGSVIVDMAAPTGGNCPLTEAGKTVVKHGVTLIGATNFPTMMPSDSSSFFGRNVFNLLGLMLDDKKPSILTLNLDDDIIAASLATLDGQVRFNRK
ncbi:MAG: Re/Si-specific NAD(P)(+) transhydrogenase subunit alpha [Oligoflexia bacterium]|nr:Re/Si-specific NAD(P)(+) transhydrogenase subunit alpha [Oligoflexia bacterium]